LKGTCNSFEACYAVKNCHFRDKVLQGDESTKKLKGKLVDCQTFYKKNNGKSRTQALSVEEEALLSEKDPDVPPDLAG